MIGSFVLAAIIVIGVLPAPAQASPSAQFLITPVSFDFGDVALGSTSPPQYVTVTNVGSTPVVMSGAGGGAGQFGGVQNCQGTTLAAGASCQMWYAFTPSALGPVTGSTSGNWNGQPFAFSFKGNGVPRFRISPTEFDFGDVAVGSTSAPQYVTVTNLGNTSVVMSGAGGGAGEFGGVQNCQGTTLAAGASCQMWYAFTPSALGPVTGSTSGNWNGQPFSFSFSGTGVPRFRISPTSFDFGDVHLGSTSPPQYVTVTNVGNTPALMSGAGGGAGEFGGVQNCQGTTLAAGASCQMWYAFTPSALGPATGSTSGNWNGQPFAFSFSGNGTPQFLITPTGFDFGEVVVGTTSPPQYVTVTNLGSSPVVMSGAGGGAGQFGGVQNCQGTTLAAGASCQMWYAFTPTALGPASGATSGDWNGQPFSFTFTGVGVDFSPPLITPHIDPASPDGSSGWYRTVPTISFTVVDPETPITSTSGCGTVMLTTDTSAAGVTFTCTATSAGGTSSASVNVKRDGTAPTISGSVSPASPAPSGWYNAATGAPTLSFTCADPTPGSGLTSCSAPTTLGSSGLPQSVTGTTGDVAGNSASSTVSGLRVDLVPPTLACVGTPTFIVGASGTVSATVADTHSGPAAATVSVPADTATAGAKTALLTGSDIAGNTASVSCPYLVGYQFVGFFAPLGRDEFQAGSIVAVKFALADATGARISDADASALAASCAVRITFTGGAPSPDCASYDPDTDQFHLNLRIPRSLAPGTYTIGAVVTVGGSVVASATIDILVR